MTVRCATSDDLNAIHALLLAVAPEIPTRIDTACRVNALRRQLDEWLKEGTSWVATDGGRVVGCLVATPAQWAEPWPDRPALHLRYAGVMKTDRGKGYFTEMMNQAKRTAPVLVAVVLEDNASGMAARLPRAGFRPCCFSHLEAGSHYQWDRTE